MIKKLQNKNRACPNSYVKRCGRGVTLVEVVLYLAILSTLVFGIASFVDLISVVRVKNQAIIEVNQQAALIIQNMAQNIRNAKSVTTPTIGQSGNNLVILDVSNNTITYALNSGILTINRGPGGLNLNNNRVLISNVVFKNLSRASTPSIIQINFTLSYNNVSGNQNYNYIKTYVASANLSK